MKPFGILDDLNPLLIIENRLQEQPLIGFPREVMMGIELVPPFFGERDLSGSEFFKGGDHHK